MAANRFDPNYFDLEKPAGGGRGRNEFTWEQVKV